MAKNKASGGLPAGRGKSIRFRVNGQEHRFAIGTGPAKVAPTDTLVTTLRETLGLTGTKVSCDQGTCGACTVLMDGKAVLSCTTLTVECGGKDIKTIEGLADPVTGNLAPLQQAFVDRTAFQCGFCTPGIIMSAEALLARHPSPGEEEVQEALSGNFCRCISHYHVLQAVLAALRKRRRDDGQ